MTLLLLSAEILKTKLYYFTLKLIESSFTCITTPVEASV